MEKYCTAGQATDDNIVRRMRIACWIPKATNTHSQYVILIAFPLQQWLHGRASVLRYTYIGMEMNVEKNKSNDNFRTTIASKNYDRPKTTRECGIF